MTTPPSIVEQFREECVELLGGIEEILDRLGHQPATAKDASLLRRLFHSIKGGATFAGVEEITRLAHEVEDLLGGVSHGTVPAELLRALAASHDAIHQALAGAAGLDHNDAATPGRPAPMLATPVAPAPAAATPAPGTPTRGADHPTAQAAPMVELSTLRVSNEKLDLLVDLASELVLVRNQVNSVLRDPELRLTESPSLRRALAALEHLNVITNDLQHAVMETRLVRVQDLVRDMPRQVRALAKRLEKSIECEIEGEDIELDKSLIERLKHPLGHLVSNACDHGIEAPGRRIAAGKPPLGTVRFRAVQEENFVRILFEDDGAGIDHRDLLRAARARGMISPAEAETRTRESALSLIFEPGFSSREEVSDTSGRGIGLDVVRQEIEAMNGSITFTTSPGVGTTFEIRLPLSLFVVQVLNVRVGEQLYALPNTNVVEIMKVDGARHHLDALQHLVHGDRVYPVVNLEAGFRLPEAPSDRPPPRYYVIFSHIGRRAALPVDAIVSQEDLVVRNLTGRLSRIPGCRGLSILGDGTVVPVLDIGYLVDPTLQAAARERG